MGNVELNSAGLHHALAAEEKAARSHHHVVRRLQLYASCHAHACDGMGSEVQGKKLWEMF